MIGTTTLFTESTTTTVDTGFIIHQSQQATLTIVKIFVSLDLIIIPFTNVAQQSHNFKNAQMNPK